MPVDQSNLTACVEVTVTHNPLAFFYEMFTPTITINWAYLDKVDTNSGGFGGV